MAIPWIVGVDIFCGAGGLTYGLRQAGIEVLAGIDLDPACEYPYVNNNGALFIESDIRDVTAADVRKIFPKGAIRLIAGCAPCQPFSPFRRRSPNTEHHKWNLLTEFQRIVDEVRPELVTMENVPDLGSKDVFAGLLNGLRDAGYSVDVASVYCPKFAIPQHRRRLVLLASRIGPISVPCGPVRPKNFRTVRQAIGSLPAIKAGDQHPIDRIHLARGVSELNLRRLKASKPGSDWTAWPMELRAQCHRDPSGDTYRNVYARMSWDAPSPTITTLSHSFGSGRFGHPEQDRAISLREAANLQTFPRSYRFVAPKDDVLLSTVGRLIGNAVPPKLGKAIGKELVRVASEHLTAPHRNG